MKKELLEISFNFFGTPPNVFLIDGVGNILSRPHVEVSKYKSDGSRTFNVKFLKSGKYRYTNFVFNKSDYLYVLFKGKKDGFFELKDDGNFFLLEK